MCLGGEDALVDAQHRAVVGQLELGYECVCEGGIYTYGGCALGVRL